MATPPTSVQPGTLAKLQSLTPARVALGRSGASLPTTALLSFARDHARARDAVHAAFNAAEIASGLAADGHEALVVSSCAADRGDYLKRPDLGRRLDPDALALMQQHGVTPCDILVVFGDGLSPRAVAAHAPDVLRKLKLRFAAAGLTMGPVVVARGARVALADAIGALLRARLVIMLIGERPGLSAPESLGAYLTFDPGPQRSDADRNCVSNIQAAGLSCDAAAARIAWLAVEALKRGVSGVALKDDSALAALEKLPLSDV